LLTSKCRFIRRPSLLGRASMASPKRRRGPREKRALPHWPIHLV